MKALAMSGAGRLFLVERPVPRVRPDTVLVKTLIAGVCGTDREIVAQGNPQVPRSEDYLILGHEALGQVVKTGLGVAGLRAGDLVVPTVRRGCRGCDTERLDMCPYEDKYTERGIKGQHGYLCEYFLESARFLVKVPRGLKDVAVLAEPLSISVKGLSEAMKIQRRLNGGCYLQEKERGRRALVTGLGPIGLLAAFLLRVAGYRVFLYGRDEEKAFRVRIAKEIGARYINAARVSLEQAADRVGGFWLIMEATGSPEVALSAARSLAGNGILILAGIPGGKKEVVVDGNYLMRDLVLNNLVILGTVNSSADHFRAALFYLKEFKKEFGPALNKVITARYRLEEFEKAFTSEKGPRIKTVFYFS